MAFLVSLLSESYQTTSPGERRRVPQETAPQEWLAAPASLGLLARLLAAVLAGGPRGEERGAGEEEGRKSWRSSRKGEDGTAAASWLRRVQHRRFALFFPSAGCAARHFGRFVRLRRLHNPQKLGPFFVRHFLSAFKGSRDRHSHARRGCWHRLSVLQFMAKF